MRERVGPARYFTSSASTRQPTYVVFHSDLNTFRDEHVRTSVGLIVGALAGLLFVAFLFVAVLICAWESKLRLVTA